MLGNGENFGGGTVFDAQFGVVFQKDDFIAFSKLTFEFPVAGKVMTVSGQVDGGSFHRIPLAYQTAKRIVAMVNG